MTTLITGASFGIGRDLAEEFANLGHDLILVARSRDRLESIGKDLASRHGVRVEPIVMDLARPQAAKELHEAVERMGRTVDILVNNAGFGDSGPFHASDARRVSQMIELNILTLTLLCRWFLPEMVERRSGKILNVASTAAFQAGPFMSVYYATKAYVLHYTEGLAKELEGTGVTVTALCPGPTTTEFAKTAGIHDRLLFRLPFFMDSPSVAKIGVRATMSGKTIAIAGWMNRFTAFASRFTPRRISRAVVAKLHRL